MSRRIAAGLGLGLSLVAGVAAAATPAVRLSREEIEALAKGGAGTGTSGVAGIRTIVLMGDPARPGPYAIEVDVPAHTTIAPHRHRDDRTAVVVSGQWWFGFGTDRAGEQPLGPGSFYTEPAEAAHFARTGAQPAVVYITGSGPSDTRYEAAKP